jgi:hypothetical protein
MNGQRENQQDATRDTIGDNEAGDTGGVEQSSDTVAGVVTPDERPDPPLDNGDDSGLPVFDPRPDLRGA